MAVLVVVVVVVGTVWHTPLIWRGSQAKPISSCPSAATAT